MIDPLKTLTSEKRPWLVDTLGNIWNYFFNYEQQKRQEKLEFLNGLLANDNLPPTQKDDLAFQVSKITFEQQYCINDTKNLSYLIYDFRNYVRTNPNLISTERDITRAYQFFEKNNGTFTVRNFTKFEKSIEKFLIGMSFIFFFGGLALFVLTGLFAQFVWPTSYEIIGWLLIIIAFMLIIAGCAVYNPVFSFKSARKIKKDLEAISLNKNLIESKKRSFNLLKWLR
jgi:hypothetical protein